MRQDLSTKIALVTCVAMVLMTSCSARPSRPSESLSVVYRASIEEVRKAAVDGLVATGFEVDKTLELYVEGHRPRRVGVFIGSGGETAGIWLRELGTDQVSVLVDTAKSFVGMAGQRNWNDAILQAMDESLGAERKVVH